MKRNSGIIGIKSTVSKVGASGLFDTFDNYNFRRGDSWPIVLSYNSLSPNSGNIFENTNATFTLSTSGIATNTTLYYSVLLGTAVSTDFFGGITGSFTQSSATNTGSFSIATEFICNLGKTAKTFQIQIRTGSTSGPVVYTSGTYSIPAVSVLSNLWSLASTINEGGGSTLQIQFASCGTYRTHTFDLTYTGTASASADFSPALPATVTVNPGNNSVYVTANAIADLTTEGTETLIATPRIPGFGSSSIGTMPTLTINDTSTTPTGTITPSTVSVTEGNSVTFNCTISGSFTGTVYYSINNVSGTMSTADFGDGLLSGSFGVTSGSGSFVKTLIADGSAENEQFSVSLRTGSVTGPILATTATINVIDAAAPSGTWSGNVITATGNNTTSNASPVNNNYRRYLLLWSYTAGELLNATGRSTATISGLRFTVTTQPTNQPFPNYAIGFKNGTFSPTINPGNTGYTIVRAQASESFTTGAVKEFTISPFNWTGGALAIAIAWGQCPVNFTSTGTMPIGSGTLFIGRSDAAGTFTINTDNTTATQTASRPVVQLFYSA